MAYSYFIYFSSFTIGVLSIIDIILKSRKNIKTPLYRFFIPVLTFVLPFVTMLKDNQDQRISEQKSAQTELKIDSLEVSKSELQAQSNDLRLEVEKEGRKRAELTLELLKHSAKVKETDLEMERVRYRYEQIRGENERLKYLYDLERDRRRANELKETEVRKVSQGFPTSGQMREFDEVEVILVVVDNGEALQFAKHLQFLFRMSGWSIASSSIYSSKKYIYLLDKYRDPEFVSDMKLDWLFDRDGIHMFGTSRNTAEASDCLTNNLLASGTFARNVSYVLDEGVHLPENTIFILVSEKPSNEEELIQRELTSNEEARILWEAEKERLEIFKKLNYKDELEIIEETIRELQKANVNDEKIFESLERFYGVILSKESLVADSILMQVKPELLPN